jgi:hypothetical protein
MVRFMAVAVAAVVVDSRLRPQEYRHPVELYTYLPAVAVAVASLAVPVDKVLRRDIFKVAAWAAPQVKRVDPKQVEVQGIILLQIAVLMGTGHSTLMEAMVGTLVPTPRPVVQVAVDLLILLLTQLLTRMLFLGCQVASPVLP